MASGWKFSVTIPDWTQTTLEGDEAVVFYRVEVKVLPPQGSSPPRVRSVLRRYNHFLKLYNKLCTELGQKKMVGREAPSKRSLLNVNRRPDLIERRRHELQQWLWRLISDAEAAKTKALNDFLELSDATRLVQRVAAPASSSADAPESFADGSYGMSEGSSPRGDASSEVSGFTSTSQMTDQGLQSTPPRPTGMPAAELHFDRIVLKWEEFRISRHLSSISSSSNSSKAENGSLRSVGSQRRPSSQLPANTAFSIMESLAEDEEKPLRLGLHVEQRGNLRRLVKSLHHMLSTASSDLQDAVEAMNAERASKQKLAEKVKSLESFLGEDHFQREAELERLLSQERSSTERLKADSTQANARVAELEKDVSRLQQEATAKAEASKQELAEAVEQLEQRHAAEISRLSKQEAEALQAAEQAASEILAAHKSSDAAREELEATKSKLRADMKLLAKEVKTLRKQLAEASQRAEEAEAGNAASQAESATILKAEIEELQRRNATASVRAETAVNEAEAAVAASNAVFAERDQLQKQLAELQQRSVRADTDAQSVREAAEAQLAKLSEELEARGREASATAAAGLEEARARLSEQVRQAESRESEAERRLASTQDALRKSNAQAQARLERLNAEAAAQLRHAEERTAEAEQNLGSVLEAQSRDAQAKARAEERAEALQAEVDAERRRAAEQVERAEAETAFAMSRLEAYRAESAKREQSHASELAQTRAATAEVEEQLRRLLVEKEAAASNWRNTRVLAKDMNASDSRAATESTRLSAEGNGDVAQGSTSNASAVAQQPEESLGDVSPADLAPSSTHREQPGSSVPTQLEAAEPPEPDDQQAEPSATDQSEGADPFAGSSGTDLFSGLAISTLPNRATEPQASFEPGFGAQSVQISSSHSPRASEKQPTQNQSAPRNGLPPSRSTEVSDADSAGGLDALDTDEDLLHAASLHDLRGGSSEFLSWNSNASPNLLDLAGDISSANAEGSPPYSESLGKAEATVAAASSLRPGQDDSAQEAGTAFSAARRDEAEEKLPEQSSSGQSEPKAAVAGSKPVLGKAQTAQLTGTKVQRAGSSTGTGAAELRRSGAQPSPPRGMGSLMNRMGFGPQPGSDSGQGGTPPSASGALQSVWGGKDRLESFARGFIKRSRPDS